MAKIKLKFPVVAHIGNKVSHAKNRSKRTFKYNLHSVTLMINGERKKFRVPTKILRMLKKQAVTTHYKSAKTD